jgi:hypothetical protein
MWETIKNALAGMKDAAGIEIPGLPAELGSLGESADTAVQSLTESATGVVDGAAAATEGVASSIAEAAPTAIDAATQAVPGVTPETIDKLAAIGENLRN